MGYKFGTPCLNKNTHTSKRNWSNVIGMECRVVPREIKHACSLDTFVLSGFFICHVGIFKLHGSENFIPEKRSQQAKKIFDGGNGSVLLLLTTIFCDFTSRLIKS